MISLYKILFERCDFVVYKNFFYSFSSNENNPVVDVKKNIESILSSLREFEEDDYKDIKKKYSESFDVKLDSSQLLHFNNLIDTLNNFLKSNFDFMDVDAYSYFNDSWFVEENPLHSFKDNLRDFLDFVTWMIAPIENYKDKKTNKTVYLIVFEEHPSITEVISLLEDCIEKVDKILDNYNRLIFSAKLSKLAKDKGFTQISIGKKLQVRQQTVNDWFRAKSLPSIPKAILLAKTLDTSVDYLVREEIKFSNLSVDFLYKSVGLDSMSVETLQKIKNDYHKKDILNIINLLILNHRNEGANSILNSIYKYLEPFFDDSLFVISEKDFSELIRSLKQEGEAFTDNIKIINDFKMEINNKKRNDSFDLDNTSTARLLNIIQLLIILKNDIHKEFY